MVSPRREKRRPSVLVSRQSLPGTFGISLLKGFFTHKGDLGTDFMAFRPPLLTLVPGGL